MLKIFKRKEDKFQKLIEEQASLAYDALKLVVKYLDTPSREVAEELSIKEKEADELRRILIDELNRTFVTPFDREDIFALSRSIDDVVDYADTTVMEMLILKVDPTPYMQRIASLLKDAAYEIWHRIVVCGAAVASAEKQVSAVQQVVRHRRVHARGRAEDPAAATDLRPAAGRLGIYPRLLQHAQSRRST